jgi:hypothetical protein
MGLVAEKFGDRQPSRAYAPLEERHTNLVLRSRSVAFLSPLFDLPISRYKPEYSLEALSTNLHVLLASHGASAPQCGNTS